MKKKKKVKLEKATARQKEIIADLRQKYTDPEILDMLKQAYMEQCREKKITFIDESYTCCACGRQNLKGTEISYREDKDNQIILETVRCLKCTMPEIYSTLLKHVKPGHEKDMERILEKMASDFEHNYNRRLVGSVLKKKGYNFNRRVIRRALKRKSEGS